MILQDFKDRNGRWVARVNCPVQQAGARYFLTKAGRLWNSLNTRCSSQWGDKHSTYEGCINQFSDFHSFADWCQSQIGYDAPGYQLDKDILAKGNKVYSEETCVFVPSELNKLFTKRDSCRGETPIGVRWHNPSKKYSAQMTTMGKSTYLGVYNSVEVAFEAYKIAKESLIKSLAEEYKSKIDPRVFDAMMSYCVEISD